MRIWPKLKKRDWYILLAFTLVYFALNLSKLTRLPIFVDEAIYLRWAQIAWHDAIWRFISLTDGKQPLFTWFVIPFMKLIKDPLEAGRVATVVAGYFTLLGTGYSAYLLKDKKFSFYAMLLVLTSPYIFFYNRFAVMESLLTAFGVWCFAISILLAKYRRLDLAMILGFFLGFGMLVKSSALFYLILSPVAYVLYPSPKSFFSKKTMQYILLILVAGMIAALIYNVQRLSPWMHVIKDKNAFFTVPYSQIFAEPGRLWNNTLDVFRWHFAYSSIPITLLALAGLYFLARTNTSLFIFLLLWVGVQLGGTTAIARLYAPRYIAFVTPFVLLLAAYTLTSIRAVKTRTIISILAIIWPLYLITLFMFTPERYPFPKVDEGYINGWTAGYGIKEVSDLLVTKSLTSDKKIYLFTEGTFGILPHGVELYADGRNVNLHIEGIYPLNLNLIAQPYIIDRAKENETYMLINNTELESVPLNLELVNKWEKTFDTSMRLYLVVPPK